MAAGTRDLLLTQGMGLFGEQGYAATSAAQIEAAAGLSPGSGTLYKHFRSKEALLTAGLDRLLSGGRELADQLDPRDAAGLVEQLTAETQARPRRLEEDRDLFRGLESFPEVLQRFDDEEIGRFHEASTALQAELAGDRAGAVDWAAVAVVPQGATANYWLVTDLFGRHPAGVDEDQFVVCLVALTVAALTGTPIIERAPSEAAEPAPGRPSPSTGT